MPWFLLLAFFFFVWKITSGCNSVVRRTPSPTTRAKLCLALPLLSVRVIEKIVAKIATLHVNSKKRKLRQSLCKFAASKLLLSGRTETENVNVSLFSFLSQEMVLFSYERKESVWLVAIHMIALTTNPRTCPWPEMAWTQFFGRSPRFFLLLSFLHFYLVIFLDGPLTITIIITGMSVGTWLHYSSGRSRFEGRRRRGFRLDRHVLRCSYRRTAGQGHFRTLVAGPFRLSTTFLFFFFSSSPFFLLSSSHFLKERLNVGTGSCWGNCAGKKWKW